MKTAKTPSTIRRISIVLLIAGIVGAAAYAVVYITSPSLGIVNIRDVPTKDYFSIILNASEILLVSLTLWILLKVLATSIAGKDSGLRVDEDLLLVNGVIHYTYRIAHQSNGRDKIIIIIPLGAVSSAAYDQSTRAITLTGRFSSDYSADYASSGMTEPDSGNLSKFVIYDYFEPSLLNALKENGINI